MSNEVKGRAETPTAAERGQWITTLASQGVTSVSLATIITAVKSRGEIWERLRDFARTLKRAESR